MRAVDTNVVIRLVVEDDEEQGAAAAAAWRALLASGGVFLSKVVIVEVAWVLRVSYRFDRQATATALRDLIDVEGVGVEDDAAVRRALCGFEASGADLSDHLILETARDASALPVLTFDRRFAREAGVALLSSGGALPK